MTTPATYGLPVDHDAPNYFPGDPAQGQVMIHPDGCDGDGIDLGLTATQRGIDPDHPAITGFDPAQAQPVQLVSVGGTNYISDGHHTLIGARLAGQPIPATVWFDPDEE